MKIAFNAIRVSNQGGSGFDSFIINFLNEFANQIYANPQLDITFTVYTLYSHHFKNIKAENLKIINSSLVKLRNFSISNFKKGKGSFSSNFKKMFMDTFGDYFRMVFSQFIIPVITKDYDFVVAMTHLDASLFIKNQLVFVHDVIPFIFPSHKHKNRFYLYSIFPRIVKNSKKIIAVSATTKADICRYFNIDENKVEVIYEGTRFKHKFTPNEIESIRREVYEFLQTTKFLLYIGSCHPRKNLYNVLKALYYIKKSYHKVYNLIIVGFFSKEEINRLKLLLEEMSLTSQVKILGHVEDEFLLKLLCSADLLVFPTLYEGFGLPPVEAMACGCPVVVSRCGSLPEVCGDAAFYVDPYDPEDIARGILEVLTNEDLRQKLIQEGFNRIKEFNWENSIRKFIELLKCL